MVRVAFSFRGAEAEINRGALPGCRRGAAGRRRGRVLRAMLTKFETKSARVKGNGGAAAGLCREPPGRPLGSLSGGTGLRLPPGCCGLPRARGPGPHGSPCLGRAQLSPQEALDPHQPAQWRHPAVGLSDVHPHRQVR